MATPTAQDIIDFLEGYGIDSTALETSETVTITTATSIVNITGGYAYSTGDMVKVTAATTMPAPLVSGTTYYVIAVSSTTIRIALTRALADAGTYITLTTTGTGTITLSKYDYVYLTRAWLETRRDRSIIPYVERITRQSLTSIKTAVELYSGNGKNILVLDRRPIVSVTSIRYVLGGSNLTYLNLNNIEIDEGQGILKAKRNYEESYYLPVFAKGDYNIEVTYTYGTASMPDDISEAVLYLCASQALTFIGARTGGGALSVQSFTRNYGSRGKYTDIIQQLDRQAHALLRPYMTTVVGS